MKPETWNDPKQWRAQMRTWAHHWRFCENIRQTRFPQVRSDHPLKCAILCREQALELERLNERISPETVSAGA